MNTYKSLLSFCLLLVAIRRGNSLYTPLNEKTLCKNAKLVQFTNYFECVCVDGHVHVNESECAAPVKKCTKVEEVCGDYGICTVGLDAVTFSCSCTEGYEENNAVPPVCVPTGCDAFDKLCVGGKCIKKDDDTAQCGCNIGQNPGDKSDCVDATPVPECKLTCKGDNTACVITDSKFYDCGCKEGYEMKEGKCVKSDDKEEGDKEEGDKEEGDKEEEDKDKDDKDKDDSGNAFPGSGILNVGLLFIVSSIVYVLV